MCLKACVFSHVGCLSFSGFDEISVVVFEAGASITKKEEQDRKRLQNVYIFVGLTAGERVCAVSVSHSVRAFKVLTKLAGGKLKLTISRSLVSR